MIRSSGFLLSDKLLLQAFISVRIVTIEIVARFGCLYCSVFKYLSTLMLICAQSGRVSGLEQKTDPASSARSKKKGLKDKNN